MLIRQYDEFLSVLPQIATSPAAVLAYIVVTLTWLVLGSRVKRNAQLLKQLSTLPERDRLKALEAEMGTVRLKEGLSPEQYIRSKIHQYIFVGLLALLVVGGLILLVALTHDDSLKDPQIGLSSYTQDQKRHWDSVRAVYAVEESLRHSALLGTTDSGITIEYQSFRKGDSLFIKPNLGYLDDINQGKTVSSLWGFDWDFPRVAVTIVNNTRNTLAITEALIAVQSIERVDESLLRIYSPWDNSVGKFFLVNEGWAAIQELWMEYSIRSIRKCNDVSPDTHVLQIPTLSEDTVIDLLGLLPHELRNDRSVCVVGSVRYKSGGLPVHFPFKIVVPLELETVMYSLMTPSYEYDLFLDENESGSIRIVPVQHELRPGDTDMFTIRVGTSRSVRTDLDFSFRAVGGQLLQGGSVKLDILVPRTDARWVNSPTPEHPLLNR
jgi:hypothetical protein